MGVLVILIVALLEGSHVAIKKRNERIAELQRRDQALSKDLPIIGNAELLIHRLNRDDLTAIDELTYRINLGIFIRTSVAVTDKPRTISAFRLELYAEDQKYSADAEREIGDYQHRYERRVYDSDGCAVVREATEEMSNLIALVRTIPITPNTRAEGWLHFELKDVAAGHEPWMGGKIKLYAFDIHNTAYELNTKNLQISQINSSEYAQLKRRR